MGNLYIREYASQIDGIPVEPAVDSQVVEIQPTSSTSRKFHVQTRFVTLAADAPCRVAFGASPTATSAGAPVRDGGLFGVNPLHKIAVIAMPSENKGELYDILAALSPDAAQKRLAAIADAKTGADTKLAEAKVNFEAAQQLSENATRRHKALDEREASLKAAERDLATHVRDLEEHAKAHEAGVTAHAAAVAQFNKNAKEETDNLLQRAADFNASCSEIQAGIQKREAAVAGREIELDRREESLKQRELDFRNRMTKSKELWGA